jgi:uncharacterized protein
MPDKSQQVCERLSQFGSLLVAFSGGVDSSLLLALALRTLGPDRVLAVTATGVVASEEDRRWASSVVARLGARHKVVSFDYLSIPGFAANPADRCYLCRGRLYALLETMRGEEGLDALVDGAIGDDSGDYRPGARAAAEAGVVSPLAEAGFTKEEVRAACRALGLAVAERPSSPCLASRFPYGEPITDQSLAMVAHAEALLRGRGFPVCRVRHHGPVARIEVPVERVAELAAEPLSTELATALRGLGYAYVCADLAGFRSGSLNEVL